MGEIGTKAARTIHHAVRTAAHHGRPLNTHVTIRLHEFGIDGWTAGSAVRGIVSKWFQPWSRRSTAGGVPANGPPTHFGVIEDHGHGPHLHWVVHVRTANRLRFRQALERRLRRQFGVDDLPARALRIDPAPTPAGLKNYLLKTTNPGYAAFCDIEHVPNVGHVHGRTAFTSANLWPCVWKPLRDAYKAARRARAA